MRVHDVIVLAAVVLAFAVLVTAHVWIAIGLLGRRPRWRALAAFVVAPLAPYWAMRERMRVRGVAWIVALVGYVVARVIAAA